MATTHKTIHQPPAAVASLARARLLLQQRRAADALVAFDRAQQAGASADECAAGRWECGMLLGDFERAWRESDEIARRNGPDPHRLWDGSPLTGKRVIVRCLHGYGDAIQFIRYIPMLREQAASIVIETHPEMVALLRRACGVEHVITWGADAPASSPPWDAQVEVMELPRIFRTTLATIPSTVPYIHSALLQHRHRRTRNIGLIWRSSGWNPERSMSLEAILPLLQIPGIAFFNLQWDMTARDQMLAAGEPRLLMPEQPWHTIDEFAGLLASMDLVITVDTMAAHLAGALGRPVWLLLPHRADWRWMLGRDDSPWYPTMKLFRQPAPGDWEHCLRRMYAQLPVHFSGAKM